MGSTSIKLQWWERHAAEAALAVDDDAFVVAHVSQLVGFNFVFLCLRIVDVALSGAVTPGTFHHVFLAEEIGGLNGIGFIGGPEDVGAK